MVAIYVTEDSGSLSVVSAEVFLDLHVKHHCKNKAFLHSVASAQGVAKEEDDGFRY